MNLIVYFSASGVTKKVSEKLNEVIKGDLFELVPYELYSDKDLNWMNPKSRSSVEMRDKTSRVEFKDKMEDISKYDNIYVGFPVWWYTCPHIVNTFLESYNFDNKNVRVFFTSGSTKEKTIEKSLDKMYPFIKDYKRFQSNVTNEEIKEWLKEE